MQQKFIKDFIFMTQNKNRQFGERFNIIIQE